MQGLRRSRRIFAKTGNSTPLIRMDGKEDSSNEARLELDSSGDEWKRDKEEMYETEDEEDKCPPCSKKFKFPVQFPTPPSHQNTVQVEESPGKANEAAKSVQSKPRHSTN